MSQHRARFAPAKLCHVQAVAFGEDLILPEQSATTRPSEYHWDAERFDGIPKNNTLSRALSTR